MGVVSLLRWLCGLSPKPNSSHGRRTPWPRAFAARTQRGKSHKQATGVEIKKPSRLKKKKPSSSPWKRHHSEKEDELPISALPDSHQQIRSGSANASTSLPIWWEYRNTRTDNRDSRVLVEESLPVRPSPTSQRPSNSQRPVPRQHVLQQPHSTQSTSLQSRSPQRTSISRPSLSRERMSRFILAEVLDSLDRALCHTPYAVCGLAAMTVWGFTRRIPSHVSIICPSHSKEAIKCWAGVHGMVLYPNDPSCFGLTTADGKTRRIRIKFVDSGFETLGVVVCPSGGYDGPRCTAMSTRARVLGLTSLLNLMAKGYVHSGCADPPPLSRTALFAKRAIAQDIFWVLFRIADGGFVEEGTMPLSEFDIPSVVDDRFWSPFTAAYPDAVQAFALAGYVTGWPPGEAV